MNLFKRVNPEKSSEFIVYDLDITETKFDSIKDVQIPVLIFIGDLEKAQNYVDQAIIDLKVLQEYLDKYQAILDLIKIK
jgi:hypothetical protein